MDNPPAMRRQTWNRKINKTKAPTNLEAGRTLRGQSQNDHQGTARHAFESNAGSLNKDERENHLSLQGPASQQTRWTRKKLQNL